MTRCTSMTTGNRKCKRNCISGTDFCNQHNPLNKLNDDTCAICLDSIKNPMKLNCPHVFCKECISNSVIYSPNKIKCCPCCRNTLSLDKIETAVKTICDKKAYLTYKLRLEMGFFPYKWSCPSSTWTRQMKRLVISLG